MKKNLFIIISGLLILTTFLIVGSPFEFLNPITDIVATILIAIVIVFVFIRLFKLARQIEKKIIKRLTIGLIIIVAIPYLLTGLWTVILTGGNYYPMWQDISIYTNKNGEKVISEWRETSGSIYDYRNRRIFGDFGQFRISVNCDRKKLKGVWTEYNIETHNSTTLNFDNLSDKNK